MIISNQAIQQIRSWAMKHARGYSRSDADVVVEDGNNSPRWEGDTFGFKTRGGRKIYHPSSYAKKGWSNMVYSPSTRHIVVGKEWVRQLMIDIIQVKLGRTRNKFVNRQSAEFIFNHQ